MDSTQMTALVGTSTGGTVLTVLYFLYKTLVGKKIRSNCCGRTVEVGFTVEEMSPKTDNKPQLVANPMNNGGAISKQSEEV